MSLGISVVINTLNEESNIEDCILSVKELADEIVVCDMHSEDRTVEIAQNLGARIVSIERMEGQYQRMRYLAIQAASYEWILAVDADERVPELLKSKLTEFVRANNKVDVVYFRKLYWFFGGWLHYGGPSMIVHPLFFRREKFLANFRDDIVQAHNDWAPLLEVSNKLILSPSYYILHFAYPSIEKYISKTLGMYAKIEADQYFKAGRRFSVISLLGIPLKNFVSRYLLKQGFRDGIRGFIVAVLYAVYRFTVWANLWLLEELDKQKAENNQ